MIKGGPIIAYSEFSLAFKVSEGEMEDIKELKPIFKSQPTTKLKVDIVLFELEKVMSSEKKNDADISLQEENGEKVSY